MFGNFQTGQDEASLPQLAPAGAKRFSRREAPSGPPLHAIIAAIPQPLDCAAPARHMGVRIVASPYPCSLTCLFLKRCRRYALR